MSTFYIQQFGCRATQADGAALERQLLDRGCTPASNSSAAAIVVLNTCTVTAAADAQARDAIRKIHAQNPAARVIVTGCYAQRAPEELAALPGVTWVVGNSHKPQIPKLVDSLSSNSSSRDSNNLVPTAALIPDFVDVPFPSFVRAGLAPLAALVRAPEEQTVIPSGARNLLFPMAPAAANSHLAPILTGDIFAHPEFLSAPIQGGEFHHTRPILKIQDGCNNRCSFCVIPYVRGKSRSLPPDSVIREIQALTAEHPASEPANAKVPQPILAVHSPAREIVLSGINLGTYGRDLTPRVEFLGLIRRILDETQLDRLRISSIEPQDVTQDLIDLFAKTDRIAQHFHMPLQSASDRILAAMHRWYRAEHYARRVEIIHDRLPNAAIGADVIAGFPGETESDHTATLSFIERLPFTYLHVFSYSPRPGTKAAAMPDQVPTPIIKRRARELRALSEAKSAAFRHSQINRTLRVLTLHRAESADTEHLGSGHQRTEYTPALSSNYLRVQVPGIYPSNEWLDVAVTSEEGNYLLGEPASSCSEFSVTSAFSESSV
ncbi:MAG: tRNA (N(6)-L-threonylcarbamoyladenosine(37)-C(2))-methylthiotransferase MtaB [Candidatus Acidiferrum sp.]